MQFLLESLTLGQFIGGTLWYVILGVGAVALVGVLIFLKKRGG